jgi:RHS repeat-associated protein
VNITSQPRDYESGLGLDYFGARYYAGPQGRFTSPDPTFMTKQRISDPQQWNLYSYVRGNPLVFVDPDGRELRLAVFNSSRYSRETIQRASNIVAGRFAAAGVQNVTVDLRQGVPTAGDHLRQSIVGAAAFITGSQHSHMAEVRPAAEGQGLANSAIKAGEAGRNFGGSSAVDASKVGAKTDDPDKAALGLANLMTHEIAHDAFVAHSDSPDNAMYGSASDEWLFNPNVGFSPSQANILRRRLNTEKEQEEWEMQHKEQVQQQ